MPVISFPDRKKAYYEKTKTRDLALITLLLGTGIRVSECVGLDVEDLDFKNDAVKVTRKGGNEMFVYFGEEVEKALLDYLEVRESITPIAGHEHALFYSIQRKRMGVQAVENLVKKYAQHITSTKKSRLTNCAVLTAPPYTARPETFIWLPTYLVIKMSIPLGNTMLLSVTNSAGKQLPLCD